MPQLGETVTEGTITRWLKQVGDPVAEDDILFEVSTDKVDSEVPSPVAGVLSEILVPEGDTVDVGTRLAVIDGADGETAPASAPAARQPDTAAGPGPQPQLEPEPQPEGQSEPGAEPEPSPLPSRPRRGRSRWPPRLRPTPTAVLGARCSRRWCAA